MKLVVVVLALAMTGCASVEEIEHSPPTLSVISGKSPKAYADCMVAKLADSRKPPVIVPHHDGLRMIFAQKLSSGPAAVVIIEERSNNGSSIKLYEQSYNNPLRSKDVQYAATECISGS